MALAGSVLAHGMSSGVLINAMPSTACELKISEGSQYSFAAGPGSLVLTGSPTTLAFGQSTAITYGQYGIVPESILPRPQVSHFWLPVAMNYSSYLGMIAPASAEEMPFWKSIADYASRQEYKHGIFAIFTKVEGLLHLATSPPATVCWRTQSPTPNCR